MTKLSQLEIKAISRLRAGAKIWATWENRPVLEKWVRLGLAMWVASKIQKKACVVAK